MQQTFFGYHSIIYQYDDHHEKQDILSTTSFFLFLLNYNCFTMLWQFLLHSNVHQPQIHIYPLPLEPPSHPSPIPPPQIITEHLAELPVLNSSSPLAISAHGGVCKSILVPQFVPPCPVQIVFVLYVSTSIPALKVVSSVTFFQIAYICINI